MKNHSRWMHGASFLFIIAGLGLALPQLRSGEPNADSQERGQTSYMPVDIKESFSSIMSRMTAAKPGIEKKHADLLNERYDLSDRPAPGVTMDRGKPLPRGCSRQAARWDDLGRPGGDEPGPDPRAEPIPERHSIPCASQPFRGRPGLSAFSDRRD